MQLTKHFTLAEMTASQTASRKGINNVAPFDVERALTLLCVKVLEPLRTHFGKPVVASSGFRSPRLNTAIGGSASSQHCKGEAVDFTIPGVSNLEICRWISANLPFDQVIYEFGESGWVHVSYSAHRLRNQELSAKRRGGKTVYLPGLVA